MQVKPLFFDTYITMIRNADGTKMFQTFWAEVDGEKTDIVDGGRISCGFFVSNVLLMFGLIKEGHVMVSSTIEDMESSGWEKISEPRVGCVIHWEKLLNNGSENEHIGFYLGDEEAIHHSSSKGVPTIHHWTFGEEDKKPKRKIVELYWHNKLDKNIYHRFE